MSDIRHYHAGQFFAFKTQIGLKLFLFQLDNLLLLPFKLCLMGYALPFNHTVFLFLHETVDQILQQSQQTQSCQEYNFPQPNKTSTTETKSQREALPMPKPYQYYISQLGKYNFHKEDGHTFSANCVHSGIH